MATDVATLEQRYIGACKIREILPNKAVLSALFKLYLTCYVCHVTQAKVRKANHEVCRLEIFLDDLKDVDFHPLLDVFMEVDTSQIDAVDILHKSSCSMSGKYVLSLLRATSQKLRVVDLQDSSFGKDFLLYPLTDERLALRVELGFSTFRDLSQRGLTCHVLNLRSSHFRKLNMIGKFMQMHTLNMDFSASLSSFREDCFACMPNLKCLSLCETRIANLWTTSAALAKLPSLLELRFQNCLCCKATGPCPGLSPGKANESTDSGYLDCGLQAGLPAFDGEEASSQYGNEEIMDFSFDNYDVDHEMDGTSEDSSDDSEVHFSHRHGDFSSVQLFSDELPGWDGLVDLQNETSFGTWNMQDEIESLPSSSNSRGISYPQKFISYHPSPICYEKHYREYMIASLPSLRVLDNLPIKKIDREKANVIFSQHFEYLPYKRKSKESVVSILQNREIKATHTCMHRWRHNSSNASRKSQYFYSRSLGAAKVGRTAWPFLHTISISESIPRDDSRKFRPRQFEYHPSNPSLMVFGTLDGEVVVINHESEKIVGYIPSLGAMSSVLGLCWLKMYPTKLIAGSDNGSLKLYDLRRMPSTTSGIYGTTGSVMFDEFDQLTSVHVNSTDELFLASGYSKNVALYDINSGKRLQVFTDMHRQHINVVKFANHSPSLFATSSFDQDVKMWDLRQKPIRPCYTASSSRGNVMVCFSPDDHYLLVSAVDNEVKQLLAVDGRLHLDFGIASTGSSQNYTRSYYMNGRDYIISGSCDEHDFNMSILAAYLRSSSNSEIVK
ncbi:hypothetical protein RJ640_018673, partial [Escallonia rubra]